jgi:hypothetical protein
MVTEIIWSENINRILVPENWHRHSKSPFNKDNIDFTLGLTLHMSSFNYSSPSEFAEINLLKEFCLLDCINGISTEECEIPYQSIERRKDNETSLLGRIIIPENVINKENLAGETYFESLVDRDKARKYDLSDEDLNLISAHVASGRELFVSLSPNLINFCNEFQNKNINLLSPSNALKITGLFLRSRNLFYLSDKVQINGDHFYQSVVVSKIPSLPSLINYCRLAFERSHNKSLSLASIILFRCSRVIFTIDKLGELFYCDQNSNITELMVYYFDYLTLLLDGAVDAFARLIFRAYDFHKLKDEKNANFLYENYSEEIKSIDLTLFSIIQDYKKDLQLLSVLRNNIHGDSSMPSSISRNNYYQPFVVLPETENDLKLAEFKELIGKYDDHYFIENGACYLKPFGFSQHLTDRIFRFINKVASHQGLIHQLSNQMNNIQVNIRDNQWQLPQSAIDRIGSFYWL